MQPCCKQYCCQGEIATQKYQSIKHPDKIFKICEQCRTFINTNRIAFCPPKEFTCIKCGERRTVNVTNFRQVSQNPERYDFLAGCRFCKPKKRVHHKDCKYKKGGYACSCPSRNRY